MKRFLIILLVATFVLGMVGVALATDPTVDTPFTFTEKAGTGSPAPSRSVGPMDNTDLLSPPEVYGNSAWNYNDRFDTTYPFAGDEAKFEGSYRRFDSVSTGTEGNKAAPAWTEVAQTDVNKTLLGKNQAFATSQWLYTTQAKPIKPTGAITLTGVTGLPVGTVVTAAYEGPVTVRLTFTPAIPAAYGTDIKGTVNYTSLLQKQGTANTTLDANVGLYKQEYAETAQQDGSVGSPLTFMTGPNLPAVSKEFVYTLEKSPIKPGTVVVTITTGQVIASTTEVGSASVKVILTANVPAGVKVQGYVNYTTFAAPGPHGGYATTTNKCKTCHAVHRANGAFRLLRVDSPEDACDYCHIGTHRHSLRGAYFNGTGDKHATNGHTIGAKKTIPDSSVQQWLEYKTLTGGDGNPAEDEEAEFHVRRYDSRRMKIFKWVYRSGWKRLGPTYLYCMSCHSVHNASRLIWKPDGTNGYKLLKAAPSGSTWSTTAQLNYYPFKSTTDYRIKAVEVTLSATNTGLVNDLGVAGWTGKTIYTQWKSDDLQVNSGVRGMTVWCADCHNLNIGSVETVPPNFSASYDIADNGLGWADNEAWMHSDRTHPTRATGCQSCHLGDMAGGVTQTGLSVGTTEAAQTRQASCFRESHCHTASLGNVAFYSDWPHSAATWSTKLLGDDYETDGVDHNNDGVAGSGEHIDAICLRCHNTVGDGQ